MYMPMMPHFTLTVKTNKQSKTICNPISTRKWNTIHAHDQIPSCMTLGTRQRLDGSHLLDITSNDISIKHVSNQKLLVIYIGENLNWNIHIDHLCATVSSKISLLRQLSNLPKNYVTKGISFLCLTTTPLHGGQRLLQTMKDCLNYRNKQMNYSQGWLHYSINAYVPWAWLDRSVARRIKYN